MTSPQGGHLPGPPRPTGLARKLGEPHKLKRATIKEEVVALTGDAIDAVILNELIRCQARIKHVERYLEEERQRAAMNGQVLQLQPIEGWFYKKATELSEDTMLNLSESNMRARVKRMVSNGWVLERDNPYQRWDKTKQYRVPLLQLDQELRVLGYHLDGWLISQADIQESKEEAESPTPEDSTTEEPEDDPEGAPQRPPQAERNGHLPASGARSTARTSKTEDRTSKTEVRSFDSEVRGSISQVRRSEIEARNPQNESAIPSSTTSSVVQEQQPATTAGATQNDIDRLTPAAAAAGSNASNSQQPDALAQQLMALGVSDRKAIMLASAQPEVVTRQLSYWPYRPQVDADYWKRNKSKGTPQGALVSSIQDNWEAPEAWTAQTTAAAHEQQQRDRQVRDREQEAAASRERAATIAQEEAAGLELDREYFLLDAKTRDEIDTSVRRVLGMVGHNTNTESPRWVHARRGTQRARQEQLDIEAARRAAMSDDELEAEATALRRRELLSNPREQDRLLADLSNGALQQVDGRARRDAAAAGIDANLTPESKSWAMLRRRALVTLIQEGSLPLQ